MTFFRNAQNAFNTAIKMDKLSDKESDSNYAGYYMYMGSEGNFDYFKSKLTREYLASPIDIDLPKNVKFELRKVSK